MTSLAVRLDTSSTSQKRGDRGVRERRLGGEGGGQEEEIKKIRQAVKAFKLFQM